MNQIKIDPERIISDIDRNIFGGIWKTKFTEVFITRFAACDKDVAGDVRPR